MRIGNIGKVNIAWTILTIAGVGSFVVAKHLVDKQRYDAMKSRERMRNCNKGDYEPGRKFTY